MKKVLTNNISLKLLSVLFALVLWLVVVNIDDPEVTRTIAGIPVTPLDEEVITKNNQVYTIASGDTVTINVTGPRSEVDKMTREDFIAEAPFSEKSNVDAVPIYVSFRNSKFDKDCEITQKTMTMKLSIENILTKSYEIQIEHIGELTAAYYLGKESVDPTAVTVTAPESIINLIESVKVEVDLSSHTNDFSLPLNIKYYASTGTEIEMGKDCQMNFSTVNYSAQIYPVREIPLQFGTTGIVADGYELTEVTADKTTLKVAGPNAMQLESIVFPDELINISGASGDVSADVDVTAQLPSGVFLCNEEDGVLHVTAKIDKLVNVTYRLPISEIEKRNIPEGYTANMTDASVNIVLSGLQKYHDEFSVNDINAYVDLKNTVEGNNEVLVRFTLPENLKNTDEVKTGVILEKIEETSAVQETSSEQEDT